MAKEKKKKLAIIPLSTVFSLISMGLFIAKTLNSFIGKASAEGASDITKYAVLPLLIIFSACFVVTVIYNIKDAKAVKAAAADTKYAVKTTKSVSAVMEAVIQLINVIIAIVIAYDQYRGGEIAWYDFRYYFTLIILLFTFASTMFFIIKKVVKMKKKADKRKASQEKAVEKQQKDEEKQRAAEAARAEKERLAAKKAAEAKNSPSKKEEIKNSVDKLKNKLPKK